MTPSLKSGGLERVVTIMASQLSKGGNDIFLVTLNNYGKFYQVEKSIHLFDCPERINRLGKLLRAFPLSYWLRNLIRGIRPNILISFGESYNAFVLLSSFGLVPKTFVMDRASPLSSLKGYRRIVNPLIYRLATGLVVQTDLAKRILSTRFSSLKIHVIPNPFIIPAISSIVREKIILNIGYFGGAKNQDLLIKIFARLEDCADWKLFFVGNGPKLKACKKLAKELGVDDRVRFEGIRANVQDYYNRSRIFAFTSTSEGFPNALGEAMASGLGVISFNCVAGPSELIDDNVNGLLIPEGNETAYLEALKCMCGNNDLTERLGRHAREKMKCYMHESIVKQFLKIIEVT